MGFDVIDINQGAKKALQLLAEGGRIGTTEYFNLDILYDGDATDKFTIAGEDLGVDGTYVRVSDSVINGGTVESVWYGDSGGYLEPITDYHVESNEDIWMLYGTFFLEKRLLVLSCANADVGLPTGTYFLSMPLSGEGAGFIYSLHGKFVEVIHPIDPKYLPGVCLPVVELETAVKFNDSTELSEAESAMLTSKAELKTPIVLKFSIITAEGSKLPTSAIAAFGDYTLVGLGFSYLAYTALSAINFGKSADGTIWTAEFTG